MGGNVIHVSSSEDWDSRIAATKGFGGKGAVVDFTATWCGPCKMIAPIFEQLSQKYPEVTFLKVDVDELNDVAGKAGVRAMPTFHAYFNGEKIDEIVGADPSKLQALVQLVAGKESVQGQGRKLGGETSAPAAASDPSDMRAKLAAAAEARLKALGQS